MGNYQAKVCGSTNWEMEFHVHTYASLLVVGTTLTQNITRKHD
jgi:hypothetical protein